MKRKFQFFNSIAVFLIIILCQSNFIYSQGNNGQGNLWQKNQTTGNIYNHGLTNYVGIGTNTPQSPLEVKGHALIDSMRVIGSLKVGTNSLTLNGGTPIMGGGYIDEVLSDLGKILIGNDGLNIYDILVGIGNDDPQYNLDVWDDINIHNSTLNQGYRIGGDVVLQVPGGSNLYVVEP